MTTQRLQLRKVYYGWYIAATLAVTETVSWGVIFYAFSIFIAPMEAELGWSRAELTGGFSIMLLLSGLVAFPIGAWIDKHGARMIMTAGSILATLLVMAWSQVSDLLSFYLIWAGLGVCAAAVLYEPASAVIATWFSRKRNNALTYVTIAAGLSSTIFIPLSEILMSVYGWRDAIFILAVILGVVTIPLHALMLRRRPDDLGLLPDGEIMVTGEMYVVGWGLSLSDSLRTRFFWALTLAFGLSFLAASAVRVHFIPFLLDSGLTPVVAAFASGAIGLTQIAGRMVFTPLDIRFRKQYIVAGVFAAQAAGAALLFLGVSLLPVAGFIVLYGVTYGARTLARPAIMAKQFGTIHYGRISSVMAVFLTLASTIAPVGAGLLYDLTGSYDAMLWMVTLLAVLAALVMALVKSDVNRELGTYQTASKPTMTVQE